MNPHHPDSGRYPVDDRELPEWLQRQERALAREPSPEPFAQESIAKTAFDVVWLVAFLGLVCWAVA